MTRPINTVLIANRGEIAIRVIRTCRERGLRTVAVYSDADRFSAHVSAADSAVRIGPPPSSLSYLDVDALVAAAHSSGADAIHPGYGFLSENAAFARRVEHEGLVFIGPPPSAIETMGDKMGARRLMTKAGVPVIPGTDGPVTSTEEARAFGATYGYPLLLKAAAGGGGKGMRLVRTDEELAEGLRTASSEARSAFGDDRIYVEAYVERPRHIEVQIIADMHGRVVHLGERECSIQRRHQKVVEESPSAILTPELRARMCSTAVKAAQACGYMNAGTIEFLLAPSGEFHFLEMNTRLQVEHPVTELRTGLDLVALQLHVAEGHPLPLTQADVQWRGHAIECRICAEDAENNFVPSTGRVLYVKPASGPGIREDRGFDEGAEIPVYYDSLLSKLCVWAETRNGAIARMRRALAEYEILGVTTNIPLLRFILAHPAFERAEFSTHFIHDHFSPGSLDAGTPEARRDAAIACAILEDRRTRISAGDHATGVEQQSGSSPAWKRRRVEGLR